MHLRSIELDVPNSAAAAAFFQSPWGLIDAGTRNGVTYLRGTENHAYIVAVKEAATSAFASATFSGTAAEVEALYAAVKKAGLPHGAWVAEFDEPGRGAGFYVTGPEGEPYRFLTEKDATAKLPSQPQHPLQLAHVVFNSRDREGGTRTLTDVFGFKLSDRTRVMNFLRCDSLHHAVAYADAKQLSLNHIAFEMPDLDSMMRGIGRVMDAGIESVWGPGRHGPGNNAFAYFIAPFGACVEYTSEIQRVDDNYRTGQPDDWQWPPGRTDHWGIAKRDNARLAASGDAFPFKALAR
jgi:catechol 2,3-dioxygenase-like lactoylglutathione lyase family enzyme